MDDADFVRALRAHSTGAFVVRAVLPAPGRAVEVRFTTRADGRAWALLVPLPSARVLKPWLYAPPDDALESVQMLGILLDEAIITTAIDSARSRDLGDVTLLALAPYGLRMDDDGEHERLSSAAARGGWDGRAGSSGVGSAQPPAE